MQLQIQPSPLMALDQQADTHELLLRFVQPHTPSRRRPINLSLVIDCSGSMAGLPMKYALHAASAIIDQLTPDDYLSIVTYDDHVTVLCDAARVTRPADLKASLKRVRAGGLTNLSGGWLKGCELVARHASSDSVNRVLLLTDGLANVGITQSKVLIQTAAQKAEQGICTTTLGFGHGFDEDLLIGMARASSGNFYYIQSYDEAADVFSLELDSLKSLAAQNLQVNIHALSGVQIQQTLSMARHTTHQSQHASLFLGDVFECEDKLIGVQLHIPALHLGQYAALEVEYRYDVIEDGQIRSQHQSTCLMLDVVDLTTLAAQPARTQLTLDLAHLRIAHDKERAIELVDQQQHAQAAQLLDTLVQELQDQGLHESFEIAEEMDQLSHYAARISQKKFDNQARKELCDQSFQGKRGRRELTGRGLSVDIAVSQMPTVSSITDGIELVCCREAGKLRMRVVSDGYDTTLNVQFPRALRAEGARYQVEDLSLSQDGSFYRALGQIARVSSGQDVFARRTHPSVVAKASRPAKTLDDLDETTEVGNGILVQCVRDGSKLRARVVSDGYHPDWNMRFPRGIREEGLLFVVDQVTISAGNSYIASGNIRKFVQQI